MTTEVQESVFNENALHILRERYFYKYPDHQETEEEFFDRISLGNPEYRKMLSNLDFLPNSPTLFNVGIPGAGTLSACFKFDVADTMESEEKRNGIMDVVTKATRVLKHGGGVGYALHVRPRGAHISTTHGKAMGPISVMETYHRVAKMVTQGGKREAAQMAILHCRDENIREFIHCKDAGGDTLSTMNISVAITDEFMTKAIQDHKSVEFELLTEMAESAWKTGDPGVFFIDHAEKSNPTPWLGKLSGTNPCGEVPLLDNEACNLGSINYGNFVNSLREWDWTLLDYTVRLAIRYLDEILDLNTFPDPLITEIVEQTRKLGLGAAGWADSLALMKVPYASDRAVELSSLVSKRVNSVALDESLRLAREKGSAPAWRSNPIDDTDVGLPRNTTRTCIAPTGTIAILMGASSGIEPHFSLEWDRRVGDGDNIHVLHERIPVIEELDGFVPQTAMEIAPEWHIRHQAAWQENIDLAVSKTINLPEEATVSDILDAYIMMWNLNCVGGTIYRDKSRSIQVLNTGDDGRTPEVIADGPVSRPIRTKLPDVRRGPIRKVKIGGTKVYMIVGEYPDGSVGEVFLNVSRRGSTEDALFDSVAMLMSFHLQSGGTVRELVDKFSNTRFEPSGLTTDSEIPMASSVLDYVVRRLNIDYGDGKPTVLTDVGNRCPDCGSAIKYEEGCNSCTSPICGWSRC